MQNPADIGACEEKNIFRVEDILSQESPQPQVTQAVYGKQALCQFCTAAQFKGEIWIKASWDLPSTPPDWWEKRKDGSPVNYVYTGSIQDDRFTLKLCRYGGTDDQGDTIWQASSTRYADGFNHLLELSQLGATIYFYPNAPHGGISNKHVQSTNLLFYEIDHLPLAQQWQKLDQLIKAIGLEPCATVFTGGKSLHVYFRLEEAIAPADWLRINRKLTIIQDGDPAINNPARAMRLAGLVRVKNGAINQISLEQWSESAYSPAAFEAALDSTGLFPYGLADERWRQWRNLSLKQRKGEAVDPTAVLLKPESELYPKLQEINTEHHHFEYKGDRIPLKICLSKANQELLAGNSEGDRDNGGYRLAKDLIGAASILQSLGISSDDPRLIFDEYCQSCNPPLPQRDIERIWRSASRGTPKAALSEEQIKQRISYYQWSQNPTAAKRRESDRQIYREDWELKHGLGAFLKKQLSKLSENFKGFGKQPERKPNRLAIAPDKVTETETLLDEIARAIASGKKHILIHADGGQGKTHTIGLATPDRFGVDKLLYFSDSARNPTTSTIEANFYPMPVRNNGLKVDPHRQTPLGNPRVVWPQRGEQADLPGNCSRTPIFHSLAAKNLPGIEGGDSPICLGCPLLNACRHSTGKGYGFRYERRLAMQADRIRLHIDSSPSAADFNYSNAIGIFEETGINLRLTKTIEVDQDDVDKLISELVTNHPSLYVTLQPYLNTLRPYLTGELKQPYHGWSDSDLRAALPALENDPSQLIEAINEAIAPDLSFLDSIESIDLESMSSTERKELAKLKRRLEKASAIDNQEARQEIGKSVLKNWLPLLLEILAGKPGALRCEQRTLTITTRNDRQTAVVDSLKAAIYLDGTLSREELATRLACQPEEIHVIEPPKPNYTNMKIIQVTGMGHCGGKAPSETMQLRKLALRDKLTSQHPGIVFTDFKANLEDPENDGCWFVDSRGSNRFSGVEVRCTFGTPIENLGDVQAERIALTGKQANLGDRNKGTKTDPELQAFIDARVQATRLQDIWRQRSHRYPDQQFIYYAVTDDNLSFLQEELPGVTIEQVDAFAVTPEAGTAAQQTRWRVTQAFKLATEQGSKLSQKAIAGLANISVDYLKKIAAQWGGWVHLKKGVLTLLRSLYSASTPFSNGAEVPLDEEEQFFRDWLPTVINSAKSGTVAELVEAVVNIASIPNILGYKGFERILRASTPQVRAEALGLILALLPPDLRESLLPDQGIASG